MGLNNVTSAACQLLTNTVCLLDADGSIKSVDIPFHLALGYTLVALVSAACQLLTNTVCLLDPGGSIKSVDIPFHLALRYTLVALVRY